MKRIITLLSVCLLMASCGITRIAMDTSYKGDRITLTTNKDLFHFESGTMAVALGSRIAGRDTILAILVTYDGNASKGVFDKDDKFYFRLSDGKEIKLSNFYDKEFESYTETNTTEQLKTDYVMGYSYSPFTDNIYLNPVAVSRWVPKVYTTKVTNSYGLYPITRAQINSIIKKGVKKIRIENSLGDADMEDAEKAQNIFQNLNSRLFEEIRKKSVKTEF